MAETLAYVYMCIQSCPTLRPMDCSRQAPLSMEFFRQEYLSGLPLPSPEDLPDWGVELESVSSPSFAGGFFTSWAILTMVNFQCAHSEVGFNSYSTCQPVFSIWWLNQNVIILCNILCFSPSVSLTFFYRPFINIWEDHLNVLSPL